MKQESPNSNLDFGDSCFNFLKTNPLKQLNTSNSCLYRQWNQLENKGNLNFIFEFSTLNAKEAKNISINLTF